MMASMVNNDISEGIESENSSSAQDWMSVFAPEDQSPSLSSMLEDFLTPQIEAAPDPAYPDQAFGLFVERLSLDMPIEIQTLRDDDQRLILGTAPPSQWIETSVEPVLHRLRVTLALDEFEANDEPEIRDESEVTRESERMDKSATQHPEPVANNGLDVGASRPQSAHLSWLGEKESGDATT